MKITLFDSVERAWIYNDYQQAEDTWENVADFLTVHRSAESKTDVPMFNLAEFKELGDPTAELGRTKIFNNGEWTGDYIQHENTVRRCKANVVAIHGIVLDVDRDQKIEVAMDLYKDIEYVIYTTFNHTADNHRFRIIIPFSQPLMRADIAPRQAHIVETFKQVDLSSFTMSQSFYFHSGNEDAIAYHNRGVMIDPYAFEERVIEEPVYSDIDRPVYDNIDPAYKQAVLTSLRSCQGLGYRGHGEGGVLMFISICRSIGLTYGEYDQLCDQIAGSDSQLKSSSIRRTAWLGWQGDRITRDKRDRFIQEYGGTPLKVKTSNAERLAYEILNRK
jgi:hypothetical protein